ncbi:MAG: hypothetical protein K2H86_00080 [Muribaculaceae bacterium]|nr:hypothetical protein [Muribaculaceae bacterium]
MRLISIIFSTIILLTSCGNNKSEFDRVIFDTAVDGDFYAPAGSSEYDKPEHPGSQETKAPSQPQEPRKPIKAGPRYNDRIHINNIGHLREIFNDSNHYQLQHAQRLGIAPIKSVRSLYRTRRPIVKVTSNQFYTVDSLTHSLPYLVPEAEALLRTIGANFIDSLHSRGADGYKIIVTSLLRTPSSVKRLRHVNRNATENSTHQYATTFDITYSRFDCADTTRTIHQEDLKNLLAEVLYDLHNQNRCQVKFERHTACFHITTQ